MPHQNSKTVKGDTTPRAERLPLKCPICDLRLDYVRWASGTHFYRCPRHGAVLLLPDGSVLPGRHLNPPRSTCS